MSSNKKILNAFMDIVNYNQKFYDLKRATLDAMSSLHLFVLNKDHSITKSEADDILAYVGEISQAIIINCKKLKANDAMYPIVAFHHTYATHLIPYMILS